MKVSIPHRNYVTWSSRINQKPSLSCVTLKMEVKDLVVLSLLLPKANSVSPLRKAAAAPVL